MIRVATKEQVRMNPDESPRPTRRGPAASLVLSTLALAASLVAVAMVTIAIKDEDRAHARLLSAEDLQQRHRDSSLPHPTPADPSLQEIMNPPLAPADQDVAGAIGMWRAGQQQQAMSAVQALAERSASLRAYRLSEREYAALAHATQVETLQNMLEVSGALSSLGRGMVAAGREAREAGDMARARRLLSAALKLGKDNMGPPERIVVLGEKTGKRIADAAEAELGLLP
jgi:hypothetical protein